MSRANLEIPQQTQAKLEGFRLRVWKVKLIEGVGAAIFGLLATYLGVFLLDRFFDTPSFIRAALLCVGALGPGVLFPLKCHRWLWQTRKIEQVARLLRCSMPRLSDRMLGIIELANSSVEQDRSAVLCAAALKQVDDDIKDVSFDDAVPDPKHRAWSLAAALPLGLALLLLIVVPAAGWSTVKRWLQPFGNTPRFTFSQLTPLKTEMVVPFGESFPLSVELEQDSYWSPRMATARVGRQKPVEATRTENRFDFVVPAQQEDSKLAVSVGDAREFVRVRPKPRPELTKIEAEISLPDYLQYSSKLKKDVRAGSLSVVRGAETKLIARASTVLQSAMWNGEVRALDSPEFTTSAVKLRDSRELTLNWQDQDGLTPRKPFRLKVETSDDLPPTVMCSQLAREQVVLINEVLTFEVVADDDFGVQEIGLQWQGLRDALTNPIPSKGEAVIVSGSPEAAELAVNATFAPARENIHPQTLQVRLYVKDYLPDRERVYSPPYTLFVLSEQEHANWLAERMRVWSRKAQGVYEREIQLYEQNQALRALPTEELQQQTTRERLEKQAAAENLNARQLRSITQTGKKLILEAARNDQFNVTTMEGLAEMVSTLEQLSKERMPSVADLLKQAAKAKATSASKPSNDDSQSAPKVGHNRADISGNGDSDSSKESDESKPKDPTPAIVDIESTMDSGESDENDTDENKEPKTPGQGGSKFGLPTTTVYGNTPQQKPSQPMPPMEEALDDAVKQQQDLLEEFTKVAEELQRILDNLEGSTFVKRLKAASRRQTEVASDLNKTLSEMFGQLTERLTEPQTNSTQAILDREKAEGENLAMIKSDLEAYFHRVRQGKFGTVIREMDDLDVTSKMNRLCGLVEGNLHGQAIGHAEFWADTFDRWAEQLVGPGCPNGGAAPPGSKGGSLSPAIVLDVMKILEKEMGLREETRGLDQVRDTLDSGKFGQRAESMADTQSEILAMTEETVEAIVELEASEGLSFPSEKKMLNHAASVMMEVEELLAGHETGSKTIAAETEIIETLLQAQRKQPPKKQSKGSAGAQPGGGGEGDTEESALALIGRGDESNAQREDRVTDQTSGIQAAGYPTEYRRGLDLYFSGLESPAE